MFLGFSLLLVVSLIAEETTQSFLVGVHYLVRALRVIKGQMRVLLDVDAEPSNVTGFDLPCCDLLFKASLSAFEKHINVFHPLLRVVERDDREVVIGHRC